MAWRKNDPNLTNDPAYLEPKITKLTEDLAEKAKQTDLVTTNNTVALKADKFYVDTLTQSLASGSPKGTYATLSALQTAYPTGNNNIYVVTADGKWYYWNGSAWTAGGIYQALKVADKTITTKQTTFAQSITGKNLINPNVINTTLYYSPSSSILKTRGGTDNVVVTGLIPVEEGATYVFSGTAIDATGGYFGESAQLAASQSSIQNISFTFLGTKQYKFTVPTGLGVKYVVLNLLYNLTTLQVDGTYQLEKGSVATTIENYTENNKIINLKLDPITPKDTNFLPLTPENAAFFEMVHGKNYINPANISYTKRITTSTKSVVNTEPEYCSTGFIQVTPGQWYTVSGTAFTLFQGVYFDANAQFTTGQIGLSSVTFTTPVNGIGKCFQVPLDSNIKYVVLNMAALNGAVNGTYQMEEGELASTIVPYSESLKIQEEYLPETQVAPASATLDNSSWFTFLEGVSYGDITDKIANFRKRWIAKDKDLVVAGTGTSLTARSTEHTTTRSDASSRPPLMHSNNFASKVWDKIAWEGQKYRRYDYAGFFTETGAFLTASNIADWDDGAYRDGLTRYADGASSVGFTIPINAWQFNFIYRTDIKGSQNCTVSIAEGNGKVEVWNGSAWLEANGYVFSMRETVKNLSNIQVINPNVAGNTSVVSYPSYQVGGNTTYQKRLKMRCKSSTMDSRSTTKAVTISTATDRLLYWGVEWTPREFMLTYINAARGSHGMSHGSNLSLSRFQDNELWSFKPDLIFSENPIYNSGGAGVTSISSYITEYWGNITNNFFFNLSNPISLASRAAANNITNLEWIIFNTSIGAIDGGVDSKGNLAYGLDASGRMMSALESQMLTHEWIKENQPNAISINAVLYWVRAANKMFPTLKDATTSSSKSGNTFTSDGVHWNDTGCKVMAKVIAPVFDFII